MLHTTTSLLINKESINQHISYIWCVCYQLREWCTAAAKQAGDFTQPASGGWVHQETVVDLDCEEILTFEFGNMRFAI